MMRLNSPLLMGRNTPEGRGFLLETTPRPIIPNPREADKLMLEFHLRPEGVIHGQTVALVARKIAEKLKPYFPQLDINLVYAAGLLHDIAKGRPDHEREGGRLLKRIGLPEVADVVAAHKDMAPPANDNITEKEIVYFADKLVKGGKKIAIEQRFQEKLDIYAHDPAAVAAIRKRRKNALAMRTLFIRLSKNLAHFV